MSIHYGPITVIDENYIRNCTLVELPQGIPDKYCLNYNGMPFVEKRFLHGKTISWEMNV